MKSTVALIGIILIGGGTGTLIYDWRVGFCTAVIILGAGLLIDAIRK
jgi:hypothetical protein